TQRWPDDFSTPRSCCEIRRRGRLSRSLGSERGWAKVLAALAEHGDVRAYVEQHRALWRCAREQIATLEATLAEQQVAFAEPLRRPPPPVLRPALRAAWLQDGRGRGGTPALSHHLRDAARRPRLRRREARRRAGAFPAEGRAPVPAQARCPRPEVARGAHTA